MKAQGSIQQKTACKTCPFLLEMKMPLSRETLNRTIVSNLNNGYIHPCHTSRIHMCAGYLSFVHHKKESDGGLQSLMVGRIAVANGIINPDIIPELEIFDTIDEMLENHDEYYFSQVFDL